MNQVFTIRENEWQVSIEGKVIPAIFNSKGAALAGLQVELRRAIVRKATIMAKAKG